MTGPVETDAERNAPYRPSCISLFPKRYPFIQYIPDFIDGILGRLPLVLAVCYLVL